MKTVEFLKQNNVDVEKSLELFGDMETYNQTLKEFQDGIDNKLTEIEKYYNEADMANYAIYVHSLKSDCKYFGFTKLAEMSYEHEMQSKADNYEFVKENYAPLMEEAAKSEQRSQYVSQLTDIEKSIDNMEKLLIPTDNMNDVIVNINSKIDELNQRDIEVNNEINQLTSLIDTNDRRRMMLSQVKHLNMTELNKRYTRLTNLIQKLQTSENEYNQLSVSYNNMTSQMNILNNELKTLTDAYNQYNNTIGEITKHDTMNNKYKIIAEATSSTKGKPVIAIRDTVENALSLTNRLLDIMYDGEIELLTPTIDESSFTLPFRCGSNISNDIRYGSQSESTLLSLALELSLASFLTNYNVYLIDECDGYLDKELSDSYVMMLQNMMNALNVEQCFMISHHADSCSKSIYVLDIAKEISNQ